MARKKFILTSMLAVACVLSLLLIAAQMAAQDVLQEKQGEIKIEKIVPSARNIRELTAIYVFIGWMWLSILVLVYFLRLKVKEEDRLNRLRIFSEKKE